MNYYSPYFGYTPYTAPTSKGILSGILGGIKGTNWSGILSNVQKTLGIVNQAIPMVKQVSPIVNNAKTMFKIMNEFKKVDTQIKSTTENKNKETNENSEIIEVTNSRNINSNDYNQPTFFV